MFQVMSMPLVHLGGIIEWGSHLVVANIREDGIANHGHAGIEQLSTLAELDGPNADAFLGTAKSPVVQS